MPKETTNKRGMHLTERDQAVINDVARYGIIREPTLHRLHFADIKEQRNVQTKLKRLIDHKYLERRLAPIIHRSDILFINPTLQDRHDAVYFLGQAGAALLSRRYDSRYEDVTADKLYHRIDIVDTRVCLELAIAQSKDTTLAYWFNEFDRAEDGRFVLHDRVKVFDPTTEKPATFPLRPDGCFVLRDSATGAEDLFFLEVDRGTEYGLKRWKEKVLPYVAYWKDGHFQKRYRFFKGKGFRVLIINRSERDKEPDKRKRNLIDKTYRLGGRKQFYFATFKDAMPDDQVTGDHILQAPIWQRAEAPDAEECPPLCFTDYLFGRDLARS